VNELLDSDEQFDFIAAIHVLEHLDDPQFLIQIIEKKLKVDGLVVIETPNANDALLEEYSCKAFQDFTYWSHHPILHTNDSITNILLAAGFEIISNTGIQRYSFRNHIQWLTKGLPGGQEQEKLNKFAHLEDSYENVLIENQISDTLWVVAKKLK
jgi:2-polyprenyl-3-methyl-5-hydroxy-6-metoxy-1,4-benzoquinol methylase